MKLALKNLYIFITNHRLIAIIICICQILSIFSLFSVYSKLYSNAKNIDYYDNELKSYFVNIDDKDRSDDYSLIFNKVLDEVSNIDEITSVFNRPYNTYAYYIYPQKQLSALYFGSYFTKNEFYSGKKYVVVGNYNRTDKSEIDSAEMVREVGNDYEIDKENYKVIGCNLDKWDEISYYSLTASQKRNIEKIAFVFKEIPTQSEQHKLINILSDLFPNSEISPPQSTDNTENHFWERIASFSICILSVITLSYLINYVFELRKKTNAIYLIVGIKERQLALSLFIELILSNTCIYVFCSLVFKILFSKLMLHFNIIMYELGIKQYLYLYLVFMLCIVLILGINVITSIKKSSKEMYRRCL